MKPGTLAVYRNKFDRFALVWKSFDELDSDTLGSICDSDVVIILGEVCNLQLCFYYQALTKFGIGYVRSGQGFNMLEPLVVNGA